MEFWEGRSASGAVLLIGSVRTVRDTFSIQNVRPMCAHSVYAQVHGLTQYRVADVPVQLVLGNHVQAAPGDLGGTLLQRDALGYQVVAARKIDEEVDITVGTLFTPCDGTEYAYAARAVAAACGVDLVPALTELFQ